MLSAILALAALALVLSLVLAVAARVFAVEVDPRAERIEDALPGANCGACGLPGCSELARRIAEGKADIDACPVGGEETARNIAAIMGIDYSGGGVRLVAMVMCNGSDEVARKKFWYNGVSDCNSAALLFGGDKSCTWGCLGLGTCAGVCPFGAIDMLDSGLAVVDPDRCTGCTKCVSACPKGIIRMVPVDAKVHILCSSHDKGARTRKVCSVGCIGCMKCVKAAPEGAIAMDRNLAVVGYETAIPPGVAEECPMKTIHVRGLDEPAALDAAAGGEA